MTLALPNTGLAVTIDIGDVTDFHPRNKQDVGLRLALWALAKTYGHDVACSGPIYKSMTAEGSRIRVTFDYTGGGLLSKGGPLRHFAVAGADRKFVWAQAEIEGDTVVAASPLVPEPKALRYAWSENPDGCNLSNASGLPASPFRTDDWPALTAGKRWPGE
jgi:sialate O-acetylesterase